MQTLITKTTSKGNAIQIDLDGANIIATIDGVQASHHDTVVTYPQPVTVGTVTIAGYLQTAKIALTKDEVFTITATAKANIAAARKAAAIRERNQPTDLFAEMDREDSAW